MKAFSVFLILFVFQLQLIAAQVNDQYEELLSTVRQAASKPSKISDEEWKQFARDTAGRFSVDAKLYQKCKARFLIEADPRMRFRIGQLFYAYFLTQAESAGSFRPVDTEIIVSMYSDPDPDVRGLAMLPIRKTQDEVYNLLQTKFLYDAEASARYVALRDLGKRVGFLGIPYYLMLLEDRNQTVRKEAIAAITACEKRVYLVPLLRRIEELDPQKDENAIVFQDLFFGFMRNAELIEDKPNAGEMKRIIVSHLKSELEIIALNSQ